jgi:YidC/Oxa1 family membrane protein insertase
VFDAIATLLSWFYDLVPNYAFAIAGLTLVVMIVLTPLTLKGTRSMMAMQRLQPEIKRLQQEHKGDRQKLNEELMRFYQENKINPLGGCLPLLLQMPVFLVLYRVLSQLTRRGPDGNFDPAYLDPNSQMYQDLSSTDRMMALGMDLSESAARALGDSIVHGIPYLILVLAVAGSSYYQQRQITVRNQKHGAAQSISSQQQLLLKLLPAFFAVISLTLPAGIVLYFLVSNLYRIGQQAFISHQMQKEAAAELAAKAKSGNTEGSAGAKAIDTTATESASGDGGEEAASPDAEVTKGGPPASKGGRSRGRSQPATSGGAPKDGSEGTDGSGNGSSRSAASSSSSRGSAGSSKKGKGSTPPKGRPTPSSSGSSRRTSSGRVTPPGSSGSARRRKKK